MEEWENDIQECEAEYESFNDEIENLAYEKMQRYDEEEERKYYENYGCRDAFEDDPEAEWNID
jgi:hypothetical protein